LAGAQRGYLVGVKGVAKMAIDLPGVGGVVEGGNDEIGAPLRSSRSKI
jgi:hypothetical protein